MTFYVENETETVFPFSVEEVTRQVAMEVLEREGCTLDIQVNVLLTDNDTIRTFNRENRGIDRETDVLSFPNQLRTAYSARTDLPRSGNGKKTLTQG